MAKGKARRPNLVQLLVAEQRVRVARTEAAADVVIHKFCAGMQLTDADALALEACLVTADAMVAAARKVG
jgi:hypothetical protein